MASFANDLLVENNEIAFNNFAHYSNEWEAGGSKFWSTTNLTVRGNNVHDNPGAGLWSDTDNTATLYENNIVTNNSGDGIRHEVSYSATIRNNTVKNNGNVQIILYSSNNSEVYGNTIEIDAPSQDGILVAQDIVGPGILGDYVHHNTTTILPVAAADDVAMSGGALNVGSWPVGATPFDYNTYYVPNPAAIHWQWPENGTWNEFLLKGNELHGHLYATGSSIVATVSEPNIVAIAMMLLASLRRRLPR